MFPATGTMSASTLARQLGSWRTSGSPAYLALADALRLLVLDGRVPVGTSLPSERTLAGHLDVSRTTVTAAYTALRDSGHLRSRQGARSVLSLPHSAPAEPSDTGIEADLIRLNIAAPSAPVQIVHDGYQHAVECAPPYLAGTGLYPGGVRALRESIARRYTDRGLPTTAEQVLVTSGAQHALRIVLDTLVHPGDRVLIEQPTHHGAILAIQRHSARPVALGLHPEFGWDLDQLEAIVKQQNPRIIFTIADFHNPTGLLLDEAGRIRLGEISARYRVPVIVDETMAELALDVKPPPPLAALAPRGARIITLGSASKTIWAGLRVGWIRTESAPDALTAARYDMDLAGAVFEQLAAAYAIDHLADFLPARIELLRSARAAAIAAIDEHLPGVQISPAVGGLCLWLTLPRPVATATAAASAGLGVRIAAGAAFGIDGALERNLRIPYTLDERTLVDAVRLVGTAYRRATGGVSSDIELANQLVV